MGRIAQRPSTNAAQNKKGGWSNPRVTRLRQGTGSEFSGSLPMLSCYVLLPPACGFGGDIGVNVGAISPSAIAAGMPIALACSSTFCRTTPPCWRAVSANGEPPAGNVGGREANVPWAASVRPLCGRFGQAKSVHCAGRPCRRHTQWANSSAPNAGASGIGIACTCRSCFGAAGGANSSKRISRLLCPEKSSSAARKKCGRWPDAAEPP